MCAATSSPRLFQQEMDNAMRKMTISLLLLASVGPGWTQTAQPPANRRALSASRHQYATQANEEKLAA